MFKLLIFIFIFKNALADDEESNEKYIDLLPEEEKQEFLNRIARRILEGIKSNHTPNDSHMDITDDQLDAQDAFVQQILKEESENIKYERKESDILENEKKRLERNDVGDYNKDETYTKNEHINFEIESNTGDKDDHIDLTLREGKRHKRKNSDDEFQKETTTEMFYDVIPVKTVYDQFENDDTKANEKPVLAPSAVNTTLEADNDGELSNKGETIITTIENGQTVSNKDSVTIKNEKLYLNDLTLDNTVLHSGSPSESDKNENDKNLRKTFHKLKLGTTQMIDFEPNSNEKNEDSNINNENTTLLPIIVSENVTSSTTNNWGSTQKIYDTGSEEKEEENEKRTTSATSHNNNTIHNTTATPKLTFMTTNHATTEARKNDSSNNIIINVTNNSDTNKSENKFIRRNINANELKDVTQKSTVSEAVTSTTESISSSITNITTLSEPISKVITVSSDGTDITKKFEHNTKRSSVSDKVVTSKMVLRAGDDLDVSQIDENESIHNYQNVHKLNVYEVFEVDPNKLHFVTTGETPQNEYPLYAPVYNYAPENAYFRPYNKFGPNEEDFLNQDKLQRNKNLEQFDLSSARNRFSGYSNKIRNTKMSDRKAINLKQDLFEYGFIKPVAQQLLNQEIYYNPDDYADLEYYLGRILRSDKNYSEKNVPNSNEEINSISSIHKRDSLKDHLRNMSFFKKMFRYLPEVNESAFRKAKKFHDGKKTPEISMDYYFDRGDKNKDMENKLLRLNKSNLKHVKSRNLHPLTPNPFDSVLNSENILFKQDSNIQDSDTINQEINNVPFRKLFESMIVVLNDSINLENEKLVQYEWLKTTVNIQAAIRKLLDLIENLKYGAYVHPKDTELLKYALYLFKSSKITIEASLSDDKLHINTKERNKRQKSVIKFPKTKNTIKEPIKLWKDLTKFTRRYLEGRSNNLLSDFEDLLRSLLFHLNDFHEAIKHLSIVTEYNNQNWLQDIKILYLDKYNKKNLAKLILHLSLSRLLDSIEKSSIGGVEKNFRIFLKENREVVRKSKEECAFVLNVLEEVRRLDE